MTITNTAVVANNVFLSDYLHKVAQEALWPQLFLYELGEKVALPPNNGKTIFIPYYYKKDLIQTSITEGTAIGSSALSGHFYSGTVAARAGSIAFSDFFVATHQVPGVLAQATKQLSNYLAQKYEADIRTVLCGAGTFFSPDGATATGSVVEATPLLLKGLFQASTYLASNDAPKYMDGNYAGIFHPKALYDLKTNVSAAGAFTWANATAAGSEEGFRRLENATVGYAAGIRILESTNNAKFVHALGGMSASNSGYQGFVMAPGAYACVDLVNAKPSVFVKGLGSAGTSDPANQKMTVAVKGYFAAVAMDTTYRLYRTASGVTL